MPSHKLRQSAFLLLACACLSLFCACRNIRGQEPEQGALVAAIGVDSDGEKMQVALEVLVPREGNSAGRRVLQGFGATVPDAYRNALSGFPRAPLFGHCAVLILGDGLSDETIGAILAEESLPPEMQAVTAPKAAALLQADVLSTPAVGYDLQAILASQREIHCRIYELATQPAENRRNALPRFATAPDGSGKNLIPVIIPSGSTGGEEG